MMASPSELSLECRPHQSYSMLLKSFADHNNNPTDLQATQKLEEYLNRLEDERHKIDAFKRELPLCMQLLTNAMEASRQQLQSYKANQGTTRPVLEEFIPLKHPNLEGSDQKTSNISDKANWMVSAQLWSQAGDTNNKQPASTTLPKSEADTCFSISSSPQLGLDTKPRNGGAFLPFTKEQNSSLGGGGVGNNNNNNNNNNSSSIIRALPDLALASCEREREVDYEKKLCVESENGMSGGSRSDTSSKGGNNAAVGKGIDSQAPTTPTSTGGGNQTHRKARRCWSPDLHRRFVNALQMLGGSQVATPKQIRELMKVDGLTNDEVKSHLQKYRLHTRRPSPSPQAGGGHAPQLVVLGGIWVPPEYASAAAAAHGSGGPTIYSTHPTTQVSSHYCSPTVPADFYPQPAPPSHSQMHHPAALQHHPHHHNQQQLHVYKTASHTQTTQSSPESDAQRAGDRSESIEDGKSDSSSWKGESGDNNNEERKKLAAMRDDGEESNGSEITLKF